MFWVKMRIKIIVCFILFSFSLPFYARADENARFRFVVMGCLHFGLSSPEDYELAVQKIKEYHPDFVLFLGGMVDVIGEKEIAERWRRFDVITNRLGVPVYNLPSDSCFPLASVHADREVLMRKCFLERYKNSYYTFEYKNNLFVCLDSSAAPDVPVLNRDTIIDKEQVDFLKKAVSDISSYKNVFIAVNRSAWFPDESGWLETIHPFILGRVKVVFGARKHFFDFRKIDGINYITTGYPPGEATPIKPAFFHFLLVEVDNDRVSVKVIPIKPIAAEELGRAGMDKNYSGPARRRPGQYTEEALHPYLLTSPERESILKIPRVIKTLGIKPGMTIVDIGAGTGTFTFPLAGALKGQGKVFATEVSPEMINYLGKEIKEQGFQNVFPVQVQNEGVDPFYKKHSFDIMFLCEVYGGILHPEDFLGELRPSLKKSGRLYILHVKNDPDFHLVEFGDFKKVVTVLKFEGEEFPVFKRLSREVKDFVRNWDGRQDIPENIREKIIYDFNKMLSERRVFPEISDYYPQKKDRGHLPLLEKFIYPDDIRLTKWLVANMDEEGIFSGQPKTLSRLNKKRLHKLNRILLTGIFQSDVFYGIRGLRTCAEAGSIISNLEAVGYKFIREYDFLPYHHFLEFKRRF